MSWFEELILGIIQGLTEFLPVSSSGHLEIGQALLGTAGEENLTFAIVVHTATVLSTLVILWKEVAQLLLDKCIKGANYDGALDGKGEDGA